MWTIDWKCQHCLLRAECADRAALSASIAPIVDNLNTDPELVAGPGDGMIAVICRQFRFDPAE